MKENKYDDDTFFLRYSQMSRSTEGLAGAGEWQSLQKMLPDFNSRRVLDLGCGFGWHCRYAAEHGAASVLGIDLSEKMIARAEKENSLPQVKYIQVAIEDYPFPESAFEVVVSSLTFHYLESFGDLCAKVHGSLTQGGVFVFSVEHPVFTAYGSQDWTYDSDGQRLHWPVDRYFSQGARKAVFLGEEVTKYHRTLTSYLDELLKNGFEITGLCEPEPDPAMLDTVPGMRDELRRPMMLLVSVIKKG